MTDRSFMGIRIEGEYISGRNYLDQKSLKELGECFQEAFAKGVKAIAWEQYTPYFNDGEPCEFGVGSFSFTSNPVVAAAWLTNNEGREDDKYDAMGELIPGFVPTDFYSYEGPYSYTKHPDGFTKDQIDFPNSGCFEQVLNETFGDHTIVVVTPDRIVQFEYDHE